MLDTSESVRLDYYLVLAGAVSGSVFARIDPAMVHRGGVSFDASQLGRASRAGRKTGRRVKRGEAAVGSHQVFPAPAIPLWRSHHAQAKMLKLYHG